ncbi:MAG TPA: glycosyltransferase [Streptosporangiaceae bacterium]|nr:glycosyltransferase [Streptosporangiaceae bacterium]
MKIDLVSEHASPLAALGGADAGGQNVHVASLATALAGRGHDVAVYTRRDGPELPDAMSPWPGVTVEHVPAGPPRPLPKDDLLPYMPAFAEWLADRWSAGRPDVVHAHFWMSGLAAVMAARRCPLPVVQTFHALGRVKRRYQARADTSPPQRIRLERIVAQRASAVIATCTDEVTELAAYGARPDHTHVVPCGVDCDRFRPGGLAPRRDGPARVLTLGRLVPRKGVDTVIAAIADVPGAQLIVAGGPERARLDDDPEVARLRAVARDARVRSRVTFTGRIGHEQVPALMRSADVIVSDPWYEPFGMVTLEAMACGAAVIASGVGGHLDTVADGVTGLLVPPRDPGALAGRIRYLLADPGRRRVLGAAAAARARSRYSWARIAAEAEAVYAGLRLGQAVSAR